MPNPADPTKTPVIKNELEYASFQLLSQIILN